MPTLESLLKETNKKYGEIAVASDQSHDNIESISICPSIDYILGGGVPLGRIISINGEPSQGKSTLSAFIVSQFQKAGKTCCWIDTEACFSKKYSEDIGVDTSKLVLVQPNTGEEAMNVLHEFTDSGLFSLIVVDSTAGIVPTTEMEANMEQATIALQARLISRGLKATVMPASKNGTTIIFISQLRDNIGGFGKTKLQTGGNALRFFSSVILNVRTMGKIKNKTDVIGNRLKIKADKNKVSVPFRESEIDVYFARGVDVVADTFDFAVSKELITKSGITYSYGDIKLGAGRDRAIEGLAANDGLLNEINKIIKGDKDGKETEIAG